MLRMLRLSAAFLLVAPFITAGVYGQEPGRDGAIRFSDSAYVDLGNPDNLFDFDLEEGRTFAFWVRYSEPNGFHAKLFDKVTASSRGRGVALEEAPDARWGWSLFHHLYVGTVGFYAAPLPTLLDDEYPTRGGAGLAPINDGEWHYVALVQRGEIVSIYHDGTLDSSIRLPYTIESYNSDASLWLGWNGGDSIHFTGEIDELSVWKRALTREEIRHAMYEELVSIPDLAAHYSFDQVRRNGRFEDEGPYGYSALGSGVEVVPASRPLSAPWTTSWWAMLAVALAAVAVIYGLMRAYVWRIERQRRRLSLRVDEQTAQLSEQARQLQELDRAKNDFFGNVSHELRTPLTIALGGLEELSLDRYGPLPAPARAEVQSVLSSSRRLLRLINQMLDLARLESAVLTLHPEVIELSEFLNRAAEAFAGHAERLGITLDRDVPPGSCTVIADLDQLGKVMGNLLSNAFKFTPEGGRILVSGGCDEQGVFLSVRDTGFGIPAELHEAVFNRFHSGDSGSETGTGIGLALARDLVELHGGTIELESTKGFGSVFTVRLPAGRQYLDSKSYVVWQESSRDERAAEATFTPTLPAPATDAASPGAPPVPDVPEELDPAPVLHDTRPLVLVVDDNEELRAFILRTLDHDFRLAEATNGVDALRMAKAEPPALIVSDVRMPGMDGTSLCRALKRDGELALVPVILLTARVTEEDRQAGLSAGADDYVAKPFRPDDLRLRVRNLIEGRARLRLLSAGSAGMPSLESAEMPVDAMQTVIDAHIADEEFNVDRLAEAVGVDRTTLYRNVRDRYGTSPSALIRERRLERAAQYLREGVMTVAEVSFAVGFRNASHFSRRFRDHFGETPAVYARQQEVDALTKVEEKG